MATTAFSTAAAAPLRDRLAALVSKIRTQYAQYRMFRTTVAELNSLSNRELSDLGISRSAIPGIATEAAYGK
jgi:uncharacterized protein YjiS (DUF1127 family)